MKYSSRVGVGGADDFSIGENVETRKAGAGEREDDQGSSEFHCGGVYVLSVFLFFLSGKQSQCTASKVDQVVADGGFMRTFILLHGSASARALGTQKH
jgi:hypothetical protein